MKKTEVTQLVSGRGRTKISLLLQIPPGFRLLKEVMSLGIRPPSSPDPLTRGPFSKVRLGRMSDSVVWTTTGLTQTSCSCFVHSRAHSYTYMVAAQNFDCDGTDRTLVP